MTIGPAPMIRIDLMSVRFGIGPRNICRKGRHTKKGRAWCASFAPAGRAPRAMGLDQNRAPNNPGMRPKPSSHQSFYKISALLRLHVGGPCHLAPLFGFVGDELAEVGRRAGQHGAAEI